MRVCHNSALRFDSLYCQNMSIESRLPEKPAYSEVIACQFSSWYPTFSDLKEASDISSDSVRVHKWRKNVTIKSVVIKNLPPDFVPYMLSDGVKLPLGATKLSSCISDDHDTWSSDSEQDVDQGRDDDETDAVGSTIFDLSDLTEQIHQGIQSLGGSVFPKLNWSAPRDATWINNGTLRCETAGDVYLLVKSSDFCMHDILYGRSDSLDGPSAIADSGIVHELVLRRWCNFFPSMEFRCFVAHYDIIAISQRNHSEYFGHLRNDRFRIRSIIIQFFEDVVKHNFASTAIPNYVFDVYLDRNDVSWLIDFNIWGYWTDALLFTWNELLDIISHTIKASEMNDHDRFPELRIMENDAGIMGNTLSSYRAPIDAVDLAASESTSFQEFMQLCKKPSQLGDDME